MLAFVTVFVSIAGKVDFVHLDWRVECDCCRLQAMRHKIGMLSLSFSMCTHDTVGNITWHNLSGVDNDDFVAIIVKSVTCLLKCYDQCLGVCDKPLLNAWTLIMMLENGFLPRKYACFKLRYALASSGPATAHSVKTHSSLRLRFPPCIFSSLFCCSWFWSSSSCVCHHAPLICPEHCSRAMLASHRPEQ